VLRIGVFFDGTGNTKKPDSSKGKMSNIAKLSELYRDHEEFTNSDGKRTHAFMCYTNGVGTYDSDIVDYWHWIERKYDKGGGGGGARRIYEMIDKVCGILDDNTFGDKKTQFKTRLIDVFGFSRGAAMARDFVNTFIEEVVNPLDSDHKDIRFNFIGLFDTVGSFGEAGNNINFKPRKEWLDRFDEDYLPNGMDLSDENFGIKDAKGMIKLPIGQARDKEDLAQKITALKKEGWQEIEVVTAGGYRNYTVYSILGSKPAKAFFESYNFDLSMQSASHILQLAAADEVRKNFPLTDVQGAGEEWKLLGVHSDIGGGYAPNETEEFVYPAEYHTEERALVEAERIAQKLNAQSLHQGWEAVEPETVNYKLDGIQMVRIGSPNINLYRPKLQKRTDNSLSLIGLNLMHETAKRYHIPLKANKWNVPGDLQAYYDFATQNPAQAYRFSSTPEGMKIKMGLSHHPARDPAHKYDHKISHVGLLDSLLYDTPESGNDARYVDAHGNQVDGRKYLEFADHVQREIYHNDTGEAVNPKKS
jgi:hypothetical protein